MEFMEHPTDVVNVTISPESAKKSLTSYKIVSSFPEEEGKSDQLMAYIFLFLPVPN